MDGGAAQVGTVEPPLPGPPQPEGQSPSAALRPCPASLGVLSLLTLSHQPLGFQVHVSLTLLGIHFPVLLQAGFAPLGTYVPFIQRIKQRAR